jgi:hypothetical protein
MDQVHLMKIASESNYLGVVGFLPIDPTQLGEDNLGI